MNFQLGEKLKSRYFRNDAFTSSKSRYGRGISKVGNMYNKNLFNYRKLIIRLIYIIILFSILILLIPSIRFFAHRVIYDKYYAKNIINNDLDKNINNLNIDEYFIAPYYMQNDVFAISNYNTDLEGKFAYTYDMEYVLGIVVDNKLKLFSDGDFNNDFLQITQNGSTTENNNLNFDGYSYGLLVSEISPKININIGDIIYMRTIYGLKKVGYISHKEDNKESTLIKIYMQLGIQPEKIYKVIIK